jgi:signal transduction histidine kinase/CheY-like chemotaxis protein
MAGPVSPLARLVVTPFVTIGALAAVLVWEVEHVGSLVLAAVVSVGAVVVGVIVARRLRSDLDRLTDHYESLLRVADEQSRQADAANRLKDEFLATVSHELRTPLNSILGWTRLLASGKLDAVQASRAIHAIDRAGWTQARLIEDLLDLSYIVSGRLQIEARATLVQPVVESAVESLRAAADAKHITLTVAQDRTLGPIAADPDRLRQIVWHLVSNAIKFTPQGGRVDVTLGTMGTDVRLVVEDTGIGFTPDVAAHLFERLRQGNASTTREYSGLGLGLGIVRHLAELHGGTVSACSAGENEGSRFELRIPIRRAEAAPAPSDPPAAAPTLAGISVLVVDDEPQALDLTRSTLERSGARVRTARSAREARDSFARQTPDVIVSDVRMPQEDGVALIRAIRRIEHRAGRDPTPAVALTGLARAGDRRRLLTAGYQMHVAKPIDPAELVMTVEHLAHDRDGCTAVAS